MTQLQYNLNKILEKLLFNVASDEDFAEDFAPQIEHLLNDMHNQGNFGTEGQFDPRGDFRNGEWSVYNIQENM